MRLLPDATASTSQEFEYEDDNGSGNGNVTVPEGFFDYYKKMLTILVAKLSGTDIVGTLPPVFHCEGSCALDILTVSSRSSS